MNEFKKYFFVFFLIFGVLFFLGVFTPDFFVLASSPFDITYPISELSSCATQDECRVYCDNLANKDVCFAFAQKHGFVSKDDAEKIKNLPLVGPGGCQGENQCREFCGKSENQNECFNFAKTNGLISQDEIRRFEKFNKIKGPAGCRGFEECHQACGDPRNARACLEISRKEGLIEEKEFGLLEDVLEKGGPGGCLGPEECQIYCQDSNHLAECVNFAKEHHFISEAEAAKIQALPQIGPGGCQGEVCRTYCQVPAHQTECINFAVENGFMSEEEALHARKAMEAMRAGGPGGCSGPDECRVYCENPDNFEACAGFGEKNGLVNKEDIRRGREFSRTIREKGGPGGCHKPEECRVYCENLDHGDECFEFGKKQGLIREEDIKNFERGKEIRKKVMETGGPGGCKSDNECRSYCQDSSRAEECLAFAVEHGGIPPEDAKMMLENFVRETHRPEFGPPSRDFEKFEQEKFRRFDEFRGLERQFRQGPATQFQGGPGGCLSPEECIKFCSDPANRDTCAHFGPPSGGPPSGEIFKQVPSGSESEFRNIEPFILPKNTPYPRMMPPTEVASPFSPDLINPQYPQYAPRQFGPGGCASEAECKAYCSDPARATECGIYVPPSITPELKNSSSPQSGFLRFLSAMLGVILPGFRY
ncbi:MAG: hypothetical protein HYV52_03750 [Parcubacteria group bacterium]|nr:hypothetical protein [Parcubacteria group bacterium]